jgi:sentrin-specific protease 7
LNIDTVIDYLFVQPFICLVVHSYFTFLDFSLNEQLNGDWFPPAEASLKRTLIQRLISELLQNRSREVSSGGCSIEPQSDFSEMNGKESGLGLVSERCTPAGACHVNLSSSDPGQGIEITLLEASSVRNSHCVDDSGLVLRELFEPGVAAGSLLTHCPSFDQSSSYYHHLNDTMSQIEVLTLSIILAKWFRRHAIYSAFFLLVET